MQLGEVDWGVLRGAIAMLVGSLVVSGAVVAGAHYYGSGVAAAHTKESRRLASARGSYLTLDDEQRLIDTYYPMYRELEERGIIGAEQRLDWVETLRTAATRLKLPRLQYEITTREAYQPDFPVKSGRFAVFASDMSLDIGLLHEEDLPALLAELNRNAKGLFSVSDCELKRRGVEFKMNPTAENLVARCAVRWYTINQRQEEEGRGSRRPRA